MSRLLTFFVVVLIAACGGDMGPISTPTVSEIKAVDLSYGKNATFVFIGDNMNLGMTVSIPHCTGQAIVAGSTPLVQQVSCKVSAVGPLLAEARDGTGQLLFSQTFTVLMPQVKLTTSVGTIVAELNPVVAPATVNNFLRYVNAGFYSKTIFHRVIAGFVVQGGGYEPGPSLAIPPFAPVVLESNKGLSNLRGTLAMARMRDPDSALSQFYFNLVDNLPLDYQSSDNPGYAVFGKVLQGMAVIDAIGGVPTTQRNGMPDVPVTDVVLLSAVQIQ